MKTCLTVKKLPLYFQDQTIDLQYEYSVYVNGQVFIMKWGSNTF